MPCYPKVWLIRSQSSQSTLRNMRMLLCNGLEPGNCKYVSRSTPRSLSSSSSSHCRCHRFTTCAHSRPLDPLQLIRASPASRQSAVLLSAAVALTGSVAAVEAILQLQTPLQSLDMAAMYAVCNIIPSCVWGTVPLSTICEILDEPPSCVVPELPASTAVVIAQLSATRSVVASFMMLTQFFRVANVLGTTDRELKDRCRQGLERVRTDLPQVVLRVCGAESETTSVALARYPAHIFPIYDSTQVGSAKRAVRTAMKLHERSGRGMQPVAASIPREEYGVLQAWRAAALNRVGLVPTSTGRRLLIIEADCTSAGQALLPRTTEDLSVPDASAATQQLERITAASLATEAAQSSIRDALQAWAASRGWIPSSMLAWLPKRRTSAAFRSVRVLLVNPATQVFTGSGWAHTLREQISLTHEFDIVIDSRGPALLALLRWLSYITTARPAASKKSEQEEEQEGSSAAEPGHEPAESSNKQQGKSKSVLAPPSQLEQVTQQDDAAHAPAAGQATAPSSALQEMMDLASKLFGMWSGAMALRVCLAHTPARTLPLDARGTAHSPLPQVIVEAIRSMTRSLACRPSAWTLTSRHCFGACKQCWSSGALWC